MRQTGDRFTLEHVYIWVVCCVVHICMQFDFAMSIWVVRVGIGIYRVVS